MTDSTVSQSSLSESPLSAEELRKIDAYWPRPFTFAWA